MAKKARNLLNSLQTVADTPSGVPWAGLAACLVAVYALAYMGGFAMESTQGWTGSLGLLLRIVLLPLLVLALPLWSLVVEGNYAPLLVLVLAPPICLGLWYWQGQTGD